jgi:hemin uptake protein HemP
MIIFEAKVMKPSNIKESIENDKIILDAEGPFPRRIIIKDCMGYKKEYRLVKTQSGNFILNK